MKPQARSTDLSCILTEFAHYSEEASGSGKTEIVSCSRWPKHDLVYGLHVGSVGRRAQLQDPDSAGPPQSRAAHH